MASIFNENEIDSRKQFSKLFCEGRIFCRCDKTEALNEDEWTVPIIDDIIHQIFPENVLAMDSLETIIHMLGWSQAGLYFTCVQKSEVISFILPHIAPYVSTRTFIRLKLVDQDKAITSCGEFYNTFFLCADYPWVKITRKDLYSLYQSWCTKTNNYPVAVTTFTRAFEYFGHRVVKGYFNGMSGVTFYEMKFSPSEVRKNVQTQEQEKEDQREKRTNGKESFRNVGGTGNKIPQQSLQRKETNVQADEGRQNSTTGDGGNSTEHDKDNTGNIKSDEPIVSNDNQHTGNSDEIPNIRPIQGISETNRSNTKLLDGFANHINEQLSVPRNFAPEETNSTGTNSNYHKPVNFPNDPTRILERIGELSRDVRNFLGEYRLLYKTIEEYRSYTFFSQEMESNGFHQEEQEMHKIFDLLIEYATHDLRELKKGAS
jgi:hypothetical protein